MLFFVPLRLFPLPTASDAGSLLFAPLVIVIALRRTRVLAVISRLKVKHVSVTFTGERVVGNVRRVNLSRSIVPRGAVCFKEREGFYLRGIFVVRCEGLFGCRPHCVDYAGLGGVLLDVSFLDGGGCFYSLGYRERGAIVGWWRLWGVVTAGRGSAGGRLRIRRVISESRRFVRGGSGGVVCNVVTLTLIIKTILNVGRKCLVPRRGGTTTTVFGNRRCFTGSSFGLTLGKGNTSCRKFRTVVSRCKDASTNGLTGTCTNVYCFGVNSGRGTLSLLGSFDNDSSVVSPTVANLVNSYCMGVNGMGRNVDCFRGTTGRTDGRIVDPACLGGTNVTCRDLGRCNSTIGTCAAVGRGCFGSVRTSSVSGCVAHTSTLGGWHVRVVVVVWRSISSGGTSSSFGGGGCNGDLSRFVKMQLWRYS